VDAGEDVVPAPAPPAWGYEKLGRQDLVVWSSGLERGLHSRKDTPSLGEVLLHYSLGWEGMELSFPASWGYQILPGI
jgi:hypothetical protein